MLEHLKSLGLNDTEAKCYLYLYQNPDQTGYEVAKNLGISRSNVYASLTSLHAKGMCRQSEGKSVTYSAVEISEVIDKLTVDFKTSARELKNTLRENIQTESHFFTTIGKESIVNTASRIIASAESSIIIDINSDDILPLLPFLEEAQDKGVEVVVVTFNMFESRLQNVVLDAKSNDNTHQDFSILSDHKTALIGSFKNPYASTALETNHPSILRRLQSEFEHDLIISKLSIDFKDEIEKLYEGDLSSILKNAIFFKK